MRERIVLFLAAALLSWGYVRAQEPTPVPSPIELTLREHFEAALSSTAVESAIKSVGKQIDARRATEAARSPLWDLAIWHYLPTSLARTLNSPVVSDDERCDVIASRIHGEEMAAVLAEGERPL